MDDLISRKAALSEIGRSLFVGEAYRKVRQIPIEKSEQRWIPVTQRLPEKGQKCLVSDRGCIAIDVFLGRGGVYNWQFYLRDYEAWMPMPEPYEEEKK